MIDVEKKLRTAYYNALNGQLTYGGNPVPVGDEMEPFAATSSLYVILAAQSGAFDNTFSSWGSIEEFNIDIVNKTSSRNSKAPVDDVASQILAILFPDPTHKGTTGLADQPGMQINCVYLYASRYIPLSLNNSNVVMRRILTFKQKVLQTL